MEGQGDSSCRLQASGGNFSFQDFGLGGFGFRALGFRGVFFFFRGGFEGFGFRLRVWGVGV